MTPTRRLSSARVTIILAPAGGLGAGLLFASAYAGVALATVMLAGGVLAEVMLHRKLGRTPAESLSDLLARRGLGSRKEAHSPPSSAAAWAVEGDAAWRGDAPVRSVTRSHEGGRICEIADRQGRSG